jgi:mRNA interferase MazF
MVISRCDVYLVRLDPTEGHEIRKTRPCLVVTPDEMNRYLATVIVAPMTKRIRDYPMRPAVRFQGQDGQIALDQLRTIDKTRLIKRLGRIEATAARRILDVLAEMFAP